MNSLQGRLHPQSEFFFDTGQKIPKFHGKRKQDDGEAGEIQNIGLAAGLFLIGLGEIFQTIAIKDFDDLTRNGNDFFV